MTTSANKDIGLWERDSLNFHVLKSFWNAPMNIYWFRSTIFIVALLKQVRYSLSDFEGPFQMLNRLVVDIILCWLPINWCTSFFIKSWQPATEARGRLTYHCRVASLKVPYNNLHFKESDAPMIATCMLMKDASSKVSKDGGLKPSGIGASNFLY